MHILTERAQELHPAWCEGRTCMTSTSGEYIRHRSAQASWLACDVEVTVCLERDDVMWFDGRFRADELGVLLGLRQHGDDGQPDSVFLTPGEARRLATQLQQHAELVEQQAAAAQALAGAR